MCDGIKFIRNDENGVPIPVKAHYSQTSTSTALHCKCKIKHVRWVAVSLHEYSFASTYCDFTSKIYSQFYIQDEAASSRINNA